MIHQHHQYPVKDIIRRQAVFVFLIRAQFGRWRLVDNRHRDHFSCGALHPSAVVRVAPAASLKHAGFVHVFDRVIAAGHIAIDGRIAHSDFGFVARRQKHFAELVGLGHQQQTADT